MSRVVLFVAILLTAAGCHARGDAVLRTEAVLHARLVSTVQPGDHHYSDTFTTSSGPDGAANCRTAANDGNASTSMFVVGSPGSKAAPLYFGFRTRGFTGPGAYSADRVRIDSAAAIVSRVSIEFRRTPTSTVSLRVAPDASGSASLRDFRSADGGTISATVTWTCATQTVAFPTES